MKHKLKSPEFINPFLVRSLPAGGLVEQGTVKIGSETLSFDDEPYPDGTCVRVSIGRDFYCESLVEIEQQRQERQRQREQREERERELWQQQREQNKQFNESLNIPVAWRPEYKPVLSGLTENSSGNGHKCNTVYHILLEEELHEGRLHRAIGQPLCSKDMGSFGELVGWHDPSFEVEVTCRTCLRLAKRWQ